MSATSAARFRFYYRENCHLCESMRRQMVYLQGQLYFDWDEVDIDRDTDLIRRFDALVPVLAFEDTEVCHHFFDERAVRKLLEN